MNLSGILAGGMLAVLVTGTMLPADAGAAEPRKIDWEELIPPQSEVPDPFDGLDTDDQIELGLIADVRQQLKLGYLTKDDDNVIFARELEEKLSKKGLDIEALLAANDVFLAEIEKQNRQVVPELDGVTVRVPGYALPLEYADKAVSRMLLVPYVGACVHSPPPPPNQLIVVELTEPYKVSDIFEPVWITGRLAAKQATESLSYVDGTADIETGYSLTNGVIKPYEE